MFDHEARRLGRPNRLHRTRRETPAASDEEIEARAATWLRRPSVKMGDR